MVMDRSDGLTEDDLLAHLRGQSAPDVAARIERSAAADAGLRAELALMTELKGALADATDGPDTRPFGWRRLEAEIARTPVARPAEPVRPWRIAAVFLGALVLGQGAYIAFAPTGADDPVFRTVSEEAAPYGLGVGFAASAGMGEVQALLSETGARIVDGPGAIGIYRLAFEDEAARDAAQARLEASPLVDLVASE
jgi:anti-sigma factor RsiW